MQNTTRTNAAEKKSKIPIECQDNGGTTQSLKGKKTVPPEPTKEVVMKGGGRGGGRWKEQEKAKGIGMLGRRCDVLCYAGCYAE